MSNSIALCGFMGCGKSTIGKLLAQILNFDFVDMDDFICSLEHRSINQIFSQNGEPYFRNLELNASSTLSTLPSTVIATGGGAIINPKIVENFHKNNVEIVFIDSPFYDIIHRIRMDNTRPLLNNGIDDLQKLYQFRYPHYKNAADFIVQNVNIPPYDVALLIAAHINQNDQVIK